MTTKDQLQERAQLVRIHEANCQIQYPSPMEANFRLAIMKKLATEYSLKELRSATIAPSAPIAPAPATPAPAPLRLAKRQSSQPQHSTTPPLH